MLSPTRFAFYAIGSPHKPCAGTRLIMMCGDVNFARRGQWLAATAFSVNTNPS